MVGKFVREKHVVPKMIMVFNIIFEVIETFQLLLPALVGPERPEFDDRDAP